MEFDKLKLKFIFRLIKILFHMLFPLTITFFLYNMRMAFLYCNYDVLKLSMSFILVSFWVYHALHWNSLVIYGVYTSIIYLNLKFDDLLHSIRVRIRWNNMQGLMVAIEAHHKATHLVRLLAKVYNIIIGVIYLIIPYIIVLLLKLLSKHKTPLYIRIFGLIVFIIAFSVIYLFNFVCANVTTKNKNAPRQLYRVFCNYKFIDLQHRLKILGLLEKLTSDFVGFRCLNLFKFTKLSFYQYFFTITSTYILVSKLLKWNFENKILLNAQLLKQGFVELYTQRLKEANIVSWRSLAKGPIVLRFLSLGWGSLG